MGADRKTAYGVLGYLCNCFESHTDLLEYFISWIRGLTLLQSFECMCP